MNAHNRSEFLYAGVDIGGTKVIVQIVDAHGKVVYRQKTATSGDVNRIAEIVNTCVIESGVNESRIAGYGFGVPGVTDVKQGVVVEAPALHWRNLPFSEMMRMQLGKPVCVENDVNCAALGERWLGAAKDTDHFVFIAVGTGVGAAIVSGGKLLHGNRFMAGEIGYLLSEEDWQEGKRYTFEHFGALEDKISGRALSGHPVHLSEMIVHYKQKRGEGYEFFSKYLKTLSLTLANVASLLNPEKIILGGGVSKALPNVIENIRNMVETMSPVPVSIECSTLDEDAGAFGAAALAIETTGGF